MLYLAGLNPLFSSFHERSAAMGIPSLALGEYGTTASCDSLFLFMSRNLTKTPPFKVEWFLEHKRIAPEQFSVQRNHEDFAASKKRAPIQTPPFKVGWRIVFLIYYFFFILKIRQFLRDFLA